MQLLREDDFKANESSSFFVNFKNILFLKKNYVLLIANKRLCKRIKPTFVHKL